MTKSELIAALAARYPQLAARDTDYAVKTMLDAMTQALASGQRIEIRGFGSFSLSQRSPRIGRNPKSGEQVLVPGKQVPHFKAGKELRERVDLAGDAAASPPPAGDASDESQPTLLGAHAM
ncbi:integration host factor subunit beta [Bordetella genomosp. 7]|uniref:Integration host factor subunit beta n=1 Tax=Bordetella genomosp. 7 TaxID=1416805 RepID=A0A261RK38_9BORD|nr:MULTISPECIES: integration host factor subunit beta [Bordetella]OZI24960.1 integration host factor subunit beta [Bordetella genomosp. 7]OZI27717.1 integration host factor subunit beta [Bordetella genomosp. 7]